jgi:hypothetical protein
MRSPILFLLFCSVNYGKIMDYYGQGRECTLQFAARVWYHASHFSNHRSSHNYFEMMRPPTTQRITRTPRLLRRTLSSSPGEEKWPLVHPCSRSLQNLRNHVRQDELLSRPQPISQQKTPKKNGNVLEPTPGQLRIVALHASIPFVGQSVLFSVVSVQFGYVPNASCYFAYHPGFGIMDNGILIIAGKTIRDKFHEVCLIYFVISLTHVMWYNRRSHRHNPRSDSGHINDVRRCPRQHNL